MTRAMLRGVLGSLLVLIAAVLPARAAEENKPSQPFVVVVGISKYQDAQIQSRPHGEDDAKALFDLLTRKGVTGVDKDHARLLLGTPDGAPNSQPATRANIISTLHWLRENAKVDDLVILAFIGQGGTLTPQGDRPCYFAVDSTVKDRAKNAVAAADFAQELDHLKSQRFCTFLDVTFKGFSIGKEPAPEPNLSEVPFKEFLGSEAKDDKDAPAAGRVLFLASVGRLASPDLAKHGIFTEALLKGLDGAADKDGYEPDGLITVDELGEYVEKEVADIERQHLKINDEEKRPDPRVLGGRSTHFVLAYNPAVRTKVEERLAKFDLLAKEQKLSAKLASEGRELLSRMPKLKAQQELRKAYQSLTDGKTTVAKFELARADIQDRTKLKRTSAVEFAQTVVEASQIVRDNYVKEVNQGQLVDWAVRGLYRSLEEKLPPDLTDRLGKIKDLKEGELTVLLADVRERLGAREDLADGKDVDIALRRMMVHLDPYTTYFDRETVRRLESDIRGKFTGIGIQIRKDAKSDMLMCTTPLRGSPAFRAGLWAGDIITNITTYVDEKGQKLDKPETISTKGMLLSDAVKKILGTRGTPVGITVQREGNDKPLEFRIRRDNIDVESVLGWRRTGDNNWDFMLDPKEKIAYVRLTSFQDNTAHDLEDLMTELKKQGVKGLILDLRFNPGGLLSSAVKVSDLFIDDGLIVTIKPRVGREVRYRGFHEGSHLDFPMVCMVNGGSASGSEIVSACLQDHKRAVIIGERSYGKGSVQNIQTFGEGEIKLTTASFWRPNGKNLNKSSTAGKDDEDWGVRPDPGFDVKLSRKETEDLAEHQEEVKVIQPPGRTAKAKTAEYKDRQLEKALEYLHDQIKVAARVEK